MTRPETPMLTVDAVVLDEKGRVLLIRRGTPPFVGAYALPGGFVDLAESVEDACRRELAEETGVSVETLRLIGVYSEPGRDPRGPCVSVAFLARAQATTLRAGDDAQAAEWVEDWRGLTLAFDHARILADAMALSAAG